MTLVPRESLTRLRRLIAPRSVALIGASAWTDAVAAGSATIGYSGALWRVHPTRASNATTHYYRSVAELPEPPDATFLAVPNQEALSVVKDLARRNAGGFVCFSAGFSETGSNHGKRLTRDLEAAAESLPYFGPNCYGFVNFFDRVALWPDQVVGGSIQRGVALICQSGTLALTLMFNARSLPIGYLFTVGNQTRLAVEDLIELLCDDPRVSAFGLYLEGIKDTARFAHAVDKARASGKPIALIKAGRTEAAARTAHSHTGALAGADQVFDAFCRAAGIARCDTLGTVCEALKVFHLGGPLAGKKILFMGASGGDMAMTSDVSRSLDLDFAPIPAANAAELQTLLSDRVTVANPFDVHTYLWFDPPALGKVFHGVLSCEFDAVGFMLDFPPEPESDTRAFDAVIDEYIAAARAAPTRAALVASLPETLSERVRRRCMEGGVIPLQGLREALEALELAAAVGTAWRAGRHPELLLPARAHTRSAGGAYSLSEAEAKAALLKFGVSVPRSTLVTLAAPGPSTSSALAVAAAATQIGYPVVIKAVGAHLEHKTEVGGVVLNVRSAADAEAAVHRLAGLSELLLVEQMITGSVAEILIGILVDPQFGLVLVLGAGGVLADLVNDSVSLLPPWSSASIEAGLRRLKAWKLLSGYRGGPPADLPALIKLIIGVTRYATTNIEALIELDVNPAVVGPLGAGAYAVDALIRLRDPLKETAKA